MPGCGGQEMAPKRMPKGWPLEIPVAHLLGPESEYRKRPPFSEESADNVVTKGYDTNTNHSRLVEVVES